MKNILHSKKKLFRSYTFYGSCQLKELDESRKLLNSQTSPKKFLKSRPDKKNIKNFRGIYLRENLKKYNNKRKFI